MTEPIDIERVQERLLTMAEVAARVGIPIATARWYRHQGTFVRAVKIGGAQLRFRPADVDAWINAQLEPAAGE